MATAGAAKTKLVDGVRVNLSDNTVAHAGTKTQARNASTKGYSVGDVYSPASNGTSPTVITSKAATTHINDKVKPEYENAKSGIDNQARFLDLQKGIENEQAKLSSATDLDAETRRAKLEEIKGKAALIKQELNTPASSNADAAGGTTPAATSGSTAPYASDTSAASGSNIAASTTSSSPFSELQKEQNDEKAKFDAEYDKTSSAILKQMSDLAKGTIPLTSGEKAQVSGLQQQYQSLIDQQKLVNTNASGIANVRGYQTGAAEYDPNFAAKTIGSIVSTGIGKIADLTIKEAAAVAEMEQAFKDNKLSAIKASFDAYETKSSNRRKSLQDTIDATSAAIKDARDAQQKQQENIDDVTKSVAENGAPLEVIARVGSAASPTEAWMLAGNYAIKASSDEGRAYNSAKNLYGYSGSPLDFHRVWEAAGRKPESTGAGGVPGYNGDFGATVGLAAGNMSSVYGQKAMQDQLQAAIAAGDYASAAAAIQIATSAGLSGENQTKFENAAIDRGVLLDMQSALKAYADAGGDTNLLKGSADTIGKRLGVLATDPAYSIIATQLDRAFQQYRQNMTGAAFGDKESSQYASVLPSKSNNLDLNLATIEGALNYTNSYVKNSVRAKTGQGGVEILDKGSNAHPAQDIIDTDKKAQVKVTSYMAESPEHKAAAAAIQAIAPNISATELAQQLGLNV